MGRENRNSEPTISVIIPSSDDDNKLQDLIRHIHLSSRTSNVIEIIVIVNGNCLGKASQLGIDGATVLYCKIKQRAAAMNMGAAEAKGDVLYFLHADSQPPLGFDEHIIGSFSNESGAGCFLLTFDSTSTMLRVFCLFVRLPWYWVHFGDQSLYVDASLFRQIGGFNELYSTMEDLDIVKRIKKMTHFKVMDGYLVTSARKYKKYGYYRVQIVYTLTVVAYLLRIPQATLIRILRRMKK